jgi:paraquat-inducible protein A
MGSRAYPLPAQSRIDHGNNANLGAHRGGAEVIIAVAETTNHPTVQRGNRPIADLALVACLDCDLLQRIPEVTEGASVRCQRCGQELWRHRVDAFNRTLALTLGALGCYLIANTLPMLGLTVVGRQAFTTVLGGTQQLWLSDQRLVAGLVLLVVVISPGLQIGFMLLILLGCRHARPPVWVGKLLRQLPLIRAWSMIEVMLLGVLVAVTKIAEYASVVFSGGLFALFALVILLAAMESCFDPREIWNRVAWAAATERDPAEHATTSAEATP